MSERYTYEDPFGIWDGYGPAVTNVDEHKDGTLWVGNGEYGTQVNFCPFTGKEAKVKISENTIKSPHERKG